MGFIYQLTLVVIIYLFILFCFCQWSGISPYLSMSISPNVIRVPERSNRTAKPIVRPKGDKNFLPRSRASTKLVKSERGCRVLDGICRVCCSYRDLKIGVFMGYSRSIQGVFTGYSYVSVMYRLCVGYVSEHTRSWEVLIQISCNVFQLGTFLSQVV